MSVVSHVARWKRAARFHPLTMDVVAVAMLCGAALIDNAANTWHDGGTVSLPAMLVTVAAAYGAVLLRRPFPIAASAVTVTAAAVSMMLSSLYWWIAPAPMIALYHLAVITGDRRRLLVAGGLAALVLIGVPTLVTSAPWWDASWLHGTNAALVAACGLALAAGDATRSQRAYLAAVEERAYQAEHSREQEARRRVTEERLRIARDLHDSMGHHIALINAQAGMAEHVFHDQPDTALQALGHIRQASLAALDDVRDTIGLLRQPGEPAAPTEPTVGISGIGDLVTAFRGSGMRVEHEVDGTVRPLPPAVGLTAYRVVQESLTNVRKHAEGAAARVRLSFGPEALHVVVEDEGNGHPPPRADVPSPPARNGAGHGIVGMIERVSVVGGSLDAGPQPGGGFRVSAVLPLAGKVWP
ncbi:sensor histidine kinase [Nonomuraea basaltis]|uniref:sensor histidine kinase n=1 Tax=Nonomuraea basaltis TaxID=2495887 RepID=UPI00110C5607|nr:histidine kinase [Nonomuraea basaltis]TMR89907.1 two-component sensor histidine kinase [Nonomuraea basaltis]